MSSRISNGEEIPRICTESCSVSETSVLPSNANEKDLKLSDFFSSWFVKYIPIFEILDATVLGVRLIVENRFCCFGATSAAAIAKPR